ncbi:MAG: ATP-binding cassette domain-containing protein [Candidatus Altiarchaeota archaeon]|nr:ATP-binding cassette domain-containing protein [Candidatus Altiarchaeota archaeon]
MIQTINLAKEYGDIKAVDNVSLKIRRGEVFGLLGPNGAGKTTLIHMLCTILKPTSGTALVNGFDVIKEPDRIRKSIGIVFQDPSTDDELTAYENMEFHAMIYGVPVVRESILELLRMVELDDRADSFVKTFSGGMRRRLEIARGLLHHPEVLFLDEPTLGLDTQTRHKIWGYIREIADEKEMTIILTTHYMEEADNICDRIAIIDEGRIKVIGNPTEMKRKLNRYKFIIKLITDLDEGFEKELRNSIRNRETEVDITDISITQNSDEVVLEIDLKIDNEKKGFDELLIEALASVKDALNEFKNISIKEIDLRKPTLDDVFIHYTGKDLRDEKPRSHRFLRKVASRRRSGVIMR